ncbi:MAG: MFS transporter [Pseudomonadota bacterium]
MQNTQTSGQNDDDPSTDYKMYPGWRIVAVAFFVDFIAVGFFFYSYGVFFKSLSEEFGGSRTGVSFGLVVSNVVGSLASPFIGRMLDRYPIKNIMMSGAVTVSIGFFLLSNIQTQWQFYLVLGSFIAIGTACMGGLATSKLVANWFVKRRGTALGLAAMGISFSGMVMPPVSTWVIEQVGWRGGFLTFSIATVCLVIPMVWLFVITRPENIGLLPDGEARSPSMNPANLAPAQPMRTWDIIKSRTFLTMVCAFGFMFGSGSSILAHLIPMVTDTGVDPYRAASVMSFCAGFGIAGKAFFGWLVDRVEARRAVWAAQAAHLTGLILLMYADSWLSFAVGASIFGFGMGGSVPLQAALAGRVFGRDAFGQVMGLLRPMMLPLHMVGIPVSGLIFDYMGNYELAFLMCICFLIISILIVSTLRVR